MSQATILIVEPDPRVARLLQITLEESLPVKIVVADTADQVLPLLTETRPQMALVNVSTRKLNAFEAIATARIATGTTEIPIIARGPRGQQVEIARVMGGDDVVSPPFRVPEIVAKVPRYLHLESTAIASDVGELVRSVAGYHP